MSVRRIFVEKKPDYAVKAGELREELVSYLGITGVKSVRVLIRYDIENLSEDTYKKALGTIFSEPPVDEVYEEELAKEAHSIIDTWDISSLTSEQTEIIGELRNLEENQYPFEVID